MAPQSGPSVGAVVGSPSGRNASRGTTFRPPRPPRAGESVRAGGGGLTRSVPASLRNGEAFTDGIARRKKCNLFAQRRERLETGQLMTTGIQVARERHWPYDENDVDRCSDGIRKGNPAHPSRATQSQAKPSQQAGKQESEQAIGQASGRQQIRRLGPESMHHRADDRS